MDTESIRKLINKQIGQGSIATETEEHVNVISTGIAGIDRITGVGGIPRGRFSEIYGNYGSGKTTFALHLVAEAQRAGLVAAYIDAEHALDFGYSSAVGVNNESLLISQPDSGEHAFEVIEALLKTGEVSCIIIDSVASLVPSAEIDGEITQQFVGLQARLISKGLRKLVALTARSNCAIIFLNQLRENIGISWGSPLITPGGRALKFYSSMRIELKQGETINNGHTNEGFQCRIKTVKNKLAKPYMEVSIPLIYGIGFDKITSLIMESLGAGLIQKQGAWLELNGQKFHGVANLKEYLLANPEVIPVI